MSESVVDHINPRAQEISSQLRTLAERVPRESWGDNSIRITTLETTFLTAVSKVLAKAFRTPADARELKWIGNSSESQLRTTCSNPTTKICYVLKFARHHEVELCLEKDLGLIPDEVEAQLVIPIAAVVASKPPASKAPKPSKPKTRITRSGRGATIM